MRPAPACGSPDAETPSQQRHSCAFKEPWCQQFSGVECEPLAGGRPAPHLGVSAPRLSLGRGSCRMDAVQCSAVQCSAVGEQVARYLLPATAATPAAPPAFRFPTSLVPPYLKGPSPEQSPSPSCGSKASLAPTAHSPPPHPTFM